MTHRADTVMDAVATAITGLTTTGNNVFRGRDHASKASGKLPALVLHLGTDTPNEEASAWPRLYSDLEVEIEVLIDGASGFESTLLTIREEVTKALRADYTLGLSFVVEIREGPAERPQPEDQDSRRFSYALGWTVTYSRNWDDPSA